ncbi:hypothetical protein HRI_003852400 [Hibiscus trionum]|uniref:Phorbol-ester/DAG-type domain-containing protein n=1 Tax=Hibiscus trionum TaxID=183268 RepID=A0A9W7IVG1_HIBTR|nr:hypothetical protein HRI_003852400 [Hibiscus trionum]
MDIKLSSKCDHYFCKYLEKVEGKCCEECGGKISDGAFACQHCDVCLHRSCAVKKPRRLSHEIMHPLHQQHPLQFERASRDFICDKCLYPSSLYRYRCYSCDFSLDRACASSASNELPKDQEPLRFKDGRRKTIQHYSHGHQLSFFKYRKIHEQDLDCFCDKIPRTLDHPFHPGHPLRLSYNIGGTCYACKKGFYTSSPCYTCEKCSFRLHLDCAKSLPTLKLAFHPHLLTYFIDSTSEFYCRTCGKDCGGASICRCVQCDISFHLNCVVPSEAKQRYHRHPLILTESVKEDDSDEFCCDVCENERDPKHPVYYCQSCTYIAHIQCVLHEDQISSAMESEALCEKEMEQNEGINVSHNLIRLSIHKHQMYEVTEELKGKKYCNGCRLVLNGPSYFCKECHGFYLHEKCAKLPYEIRHPFHSSHPLNLYVSDSYPSPYRPLGGAFITCDECKDICLGFIYFCEQCNFKLDVKCAALTAHKTGVSQDKRIDRVTELHHFSHDHKLVLGYCNDPIDETKCTICELTILGPAYFCPELDCVHILHKSCLRLPQKVQVPFHLKHMMVIQQPWKHSNPQCHACPLNITSQRFAYSCEDCQLNLHPICANYLKRPLKCEFHPDDLYYFGTDYQLFSANYPVSEMTTAFVCYKCEKSCQGEPFYRCLQCSINFHLKCVTIPDTVESKYHRHPLTLKDSFVEDDSGKYYCDFCEEERNRSDHVYYCKECNGKTIAHIECVLTREVEDMSCEESLHKKRREGLQPLPIQLENVPAMVTGVWTDDMNLELKATIQFRELLSVEKSPPIEEVIEAGVVPRFVEFLEREDFPQLQFEAAWALTNIDSGTSENVKEVIDHGAVPIFVKLLSSTSEDVREQSIWALGNVAGDSPASRDVVLGHGALVPLLAHLYEHAKLSVLRIATWTLLNFCRGKPQPPFDQIKPALPTLAHLIHSNDEQVLSDASWALSYLSDGTSEKIQAVIEAGVCGRLVELLLHPSLSVLKPALRTVGNITSGDDVQTQCIISHQALPCLSKLLTNNYKSIKKEACWTISNITARNEEQIQAVIEANIIAPLVHLLQNAEFDIKGEAAWAITNAISGGTHDQIKFLVSQGCIKPLCDLLICRDPRIVEVCLDGLEKILMVGEVDKTTGTTGGVNLYARMVSDAKGQEKMEYLGYLYEGIDEMSYICIKAEEVLEKYWSEEDDVW